MKTNCGIPCTSRSWKLLLNIVVLLVWISSDLIQCDNDFPEYLHEASCDEDGLLGMVSGGILDSQISASSTYKLDAARSCDPAHGRLYRPNGFSWCPEHKSTSEWLEIDLGVVSQISGVMTQGRSDGREWVTKFRVSYSLNHQDEEYLVDAYSNQKIFQGNTDSYSVNHNYFDAVIHTRYIKFHIHAWHEYPSLRVELIGCQKCNKLLGVPPYVRLSASSAKGKKKHKSCYEEFGHMFSNKAWCSRIQDRKQYLELDIGPPTLITGVATKGRGDSKKPQFVKKFILSYSNNSEVWFYYREDHTSISYQSSNERKAADKIFKANWDSNTAVVHYLKQPFVARFVRFHPIEWEEGIAMRAGIFGCKISLNEDCGPGFFRINNQSNCIANLAFRKFAWLNNEGSRHSKRDSHFLESSPATETKTLSNAERAVDGNLLEQETNGSSKIRERAVRKNCTILSYKYPFATLPSWYVDLKVPTAVHGVVIYTLGDPAKLVDLKSEDSLLIRRQLDNLERISVFVEQDVAGAVPGASSKYQGSNDARSFWERHRQKIAAKSAGDNQPDLSADNLCGQVSRFNRAVFQSRIHFHCQRVLHGRFLHITASGLLNDGWNRSFETAFCEVMVY